ncbi:MAG: hypothetical protein Ct9H90mP5_03980 [Acidimicrobiaceae bacterium]|nr:MAG: hypothetical protein Ct9H90mP5_03980 [Acidimicrobiaceae bacterium]
MGTRICPRRHRLRTANNYSPDSRPHDGFKEYAFDPGFYLLASSRLDVPFDPQEVVDWGFERGPLFIPGTEYSYNTVGHVIAGLVIESVTGEKSP